MVNTGSTPLISLDAVALDTETTSLDARTARVLELALVRITGETVEAEAVLDTLVDPECPVPPSSTAVHGLTTAHLAGARRFAAVAASLDAAIGGSVVVGHNIGYDLAVLDREFRWAGVEWRMPHFLDIRALARIAAPDLAGYSLDALSDWQGVVNTRRHRALPDAMATADVFVRLVPLLRARGVRTLAEAERASRGLVGEAWTYHLNGWVSPAGSPQADTGPALAAADSYPFRHRVSDLAPRPSVFAAPSASLDDAARALLAEPDADAIVIGTPGRVDGVLTAREILAGHLAGNGSAPVSGGGVTLRPLPTIAESDFLYRALGRLDRLATGYLGVAGRRGELLGLLTAGDLVRHRVSAALALGDEIETARNVPDLAHAWARLPALAASLLAEDLEATDIAAIVSAEIRALTANVARRAEERMAALGRGQPPCAYALLVLGSAGRGDSFLSADQDNALIYATGAPGGPEDEWFRDLAVLIADQLNEVGLPYCPGGVMAKNPGCRHSAAVWKDVVAGWTGRAEMRDLLAADIFFDGVAVHGDIALADEVFDFAFEKASAAPLFIASLASFNKDWFPPVGVLGRIKTDGDGRLDLKRNGLRPAVTAARTYALKNAMRPTATLDRLAEIKARGLADPGLIDNAVEAYKAIARNVLAQQVRDSHDGVPLSQRVDVAAMPAAGKAALKDAMSAISLLVGSALNL